MTCNMMNTRRIKSECHWLDTRGGQMTGQELEAIYGGLGVSQGMFAAQVGLTRPTMNRYLHSGSKWIPVVITNSVRWVLEHTNWKPLSRRKSNFRLPPALRNKKCPGCRGSLWWSRSKGEKRRGIKGHVFTAHCKAHQLASVVCPVTSVYFDNRGNQLQVPRFAPRPFKQLPFERPRCPDCALR